VDGIELASFKYMLSFNRRKTVIHFANMGSVR
jgi:hypothetical protein